jgi:hypothetical protein
MSQQELVIGKLQSGRAFTVPVDYQVHTTALIGIRGSGKTVAATVLAEEMLEHGLPFVAIDPVGVWWGLRSAYQLVIVGGEHGDLPLEKDSGAQMADAILEHNVPCVIDMSSESKTTVRKFVTDFCDRLMELNPKGTRHIFLEEAPELVPQKPMGEQKRSLAAVDRLVRLGRNKGYGCTLISQRFATINKDVLTQCENLIALRCIGKNDRDAAADWIAEVVHDTESEKKADAFVRSLTTLENGDAWFWSPQWLHEFVQIHFRLRKSHHPGETRSVGQAAQQVRMVAVQEFVESFKRTLVRKIVADVKETVNKWPRHPAGQIADEASNEIARMREENSGLRTQVAHLKSIIESIRFAVEPEYRRLQALFGDLEKVPASNGHYADSAALEQWKEKLGAGPAKIIDILLQRGECTRVQLKTLAGYSSRSMTNIISALNSNQLIEKEGDKIRLRKS